jgi:hypothetical membrane protein
MSLRRLAGICGVAAPLVSSGLIFIAMAMSPWFSWQDYGLSALGVGPTPTPFNAGVLAGGLLYLIFAVGFARQPRSVSPAGRIARGLLIASAIGLMLVGIFNDDAGRIHDIVSVVYFTGTAAAYMLLGIDGLRQGDRESGLLTLIAGCATILVFVVVPHKKLAVPEILAATIIGTWTLSMGVNLLFGKSTQL